MAQRLGIVYTPIEVVDFILHSVDYVLRTEFGGGFNAKGNDILDPFTGTGTFIVRLLQSGLIEPKNLRHEYEHEIHANELVLLAYYIAAINIENTFHETIKAGKEAVLRRIDGDAEYTPFPGIVLADTFTMLQEKKLIDENSKRAKRQRDKKIRVIIGNPPYSAGQRSQNDNNQNTRYDHLDGRIEATYAAHSSATLSRYTYDSYIRAIRWASDRIGDRGVIGFVTNGSFIDGNAMDGLRKCLAEDFTDIYIFNCRGNARTSGEQRRKEKGNVFGEGTRTPVAITILVKNPTKQASRQSSLAKIHYHDIGDYLDREEKLQALRDAKSIEHVDWEIIAPNEKHDWIGQRDSTFDSFLLLGDKQPTEETLFGVLSLGVVTNRDAWCCNFSQKKLRKNMSRMIDFYNEQVKAYQEHCATWETNAKEADEFIDNDPQKISWTRSLKNQFRQSVLHKLNSRSLVVGHYRPFCKVNLYFNRAFNECVYQMPQIFPEPGIENIAIGATGRGATQDFCVLITNVLPDLGTVSTAQYFPFYTYEKESKSNAADAGERVGGYIRRENISDAMLAKFRSHYAITAGKERSVLTDIGVLADAGGATSTSRPSLRRNTGSIPAVISKHDIFFYVYGVLNSPEYRERFSSELKKQLPRVPFATDFWGFSGAGRKLAELHLNYETGAEYPLQEKWTGAHDYRVTKMKFPSKGDKSAIVYSPHLTLTGIPPEAYRFVVNGKSAIEWILDRYQKTTHKDSQIENDPNDWCTEHDSPDYIVQLIKRVTHLSVESVKMIDGLPKLEW